MPLRDMTQKVVPSVKRRLPLMWHAPTNCDLLDFTLDCSSRGDPLITLPVGHAMLRYLFLLHDFLDHCRRHAWLKHMSNLQHLHLCK